MLVCGFVVSYCRRDRILGEREGGSMVGVACVCVRTWNEGKLVI